jgi:hypothetical protein
LGIKPPMALNQLYSAQDTVDYLKKAATLLKLE